MRWFQNWNADFNIEIRISKLKSRMISKLKCRFQYWNADFKIEMQISPSPMNLSQPDFVYVLGLTKELTPMGSKVSVTGFMVKSSNLYFQDAWPDHHQTWWVNVIWLWKSGKALNIPCVTWTCVHKLKLDNKLTPRANLYCHKQTFLSSCDIISHMLFWWKTSSSIYLLAQKLVPTRSTIYSWLDSSNIQATHQPNQHDIHVHGDDH